MIMIIRFNADSIYAKGSTLQINCDSKGVPLEKKWRQLVKYANLNKISIVSVK